MADPSFPLDAAFGQVDGEMVLVAEKQQMRAATGERDADQVDAIVQSFRAAYVRPPGTSQAA